MLNILTNMELYNRKELCFSKPCSNDMALRTFVAFITIFGVVLLSRVDGSQCSNSLDELYNGETVDIDKLLKSVLGQSYSLEASFPQEGAFTNATEDCRLKTSFCDTQLLFQNRKRLTLCFSTNQTICFQLNCSCSGNQDPGPLRQSSETLKCTPQNHENVEIQDPRDKNEEVTNTPDSTKGNRNIQSTTMKSDCPEKDQYIFKQLPVTLAFIFGTTVGSLATIITTHLWRSRTLRQNPNDKRADLSEEIPLYTSSKGLCDTSVYSEIPENNKNSQVSLSLGVQIGEYTERLSKNNTLPKVTIPLENLYEKDEGSQYQEVTLEKGNTVQNIYNHLQPNNGANNPHLSIHKEDRCVEPLYHTLAFAEIENTIDGNSVENPPDAGRNLLDDISPNNPDAETTHIQDDETPNLMCKTTEKLAEKIEADEESEELKGKSNIENTYFVLQKKE